jgi:hypothetical protein
VFIKDKNPASVKILNGLNLTMPSDLDEIVALGLVTSDIKSTSSALRFLACNGNTAPLDAQDGIGFEQMLQCHLVQLCEANNSCGRNVAQSITDGSTPKTHWVGRCDLSQAWPPHCTKGPAALINHTETLKEVKERYEQRNNPNDDNHENDIDKIINLLKDKDDFDLVLRQTVGNAHGADVMILSRNDGKVVLHLFCCSKQTKDIPSINFKSIVESLGSLGVKLGNNSHGEDMDTEPLYGKAGYSYLGTQYFANKLGEGLETKVEIGHRILIFSQEQEWDGLRESTSTNFLQKAMGKGVMVWTREMLEPTISALHTMTTHRHDTM